MPANSPFQTEKARLEAGGDYVNIPRAPQNPPGQPPPAAPPSQGSGTITYDRATIEARIDDIERNSDDPNASDFAEPTLISAFPSLVSRKPALPPQGTQ